MELKQKNIILLHIDLSPRLRGPQFFKRLHKKSNDICLWQKKPLILSQIQLQKFRHPNQVMRSQSCDEQTYGHYCSRFRRLIAQGVFYVKQLRHKRSLHRLRIYVRAVQLLITFFKFKRRTNSQMKNTRRLSKQRISVAKPRIKSGQSTLIPFIPQENLQIHQTDSELQSPLFFRKQKTLSQINFDHFLKRPIQQFIKNKNLSSLSEHRPAKKRTCKTECSKRFTTMLQFHRKLQMTQAYSVY